MGEGGGARRTLRALPALGLWIWMIPSAYFWHLAVSRDIVLPYIPQVVWAPAGALWELSRLLYVFVLALASILMYQLSARVRVNRPLRRTGLVLTGVSAIVHIRWGGAVMSASRGG